MKTLHLPIHFHRHPHPHAMQHLKDLVHDYRAQSVLSTWFLIVMFLILFVMALQAH